MRCGQVIPVHGSKWWLTQAVRLRHEYFSWVVSRTSSLQYHLLPTARHCPGVLDFLIDRPDRQGSTPSIA